MTQRTLTALYDTSGAADAARNELLALGVPSADIDIRGAEAGTAAAADQDRGFWASLADLFMPDEDRHAYAEGLRRGGCLLTARVPQGLEDAALDALERSGPVDVDERSQSWRESGWQGYEGVAATSGTGGAGATAVLREDAASFRGAAAGTASASAGTGRTVEGEEAIPIVEEELRVGKREVGRGSVRVRSFVREIPVEEQVDLKQERVTLERRPVSRELAPGEAAAAFQEREIEAVERGEEAVVSKSAQVVEEVAVRKDVERETETVRDTVHRTEVEVEDDRAGHGLGRPADATTPR